MVGKRPLILITFILLLGFVVWGGTAVYHQTIHSLKPTNYPNLTLVFDTARCGEVAFSRIHKGYSLITYDCYTTEDGINHVILHYLSDGFRLEGRLLRHQAQETPVRTNLTHMVNMYPHDDAPMQVRVTTIFTAQLPRLRDPVANPAERAIIPSAR